MQSIPIEQVVKRLALENPWWIGDTGVGERLNAMKPRAYLDLLYTLIAETPVRRAILLMGPRRVGKTVLIHHVIQRLITVKQVDPRQICYVSVDHPLYNDCSLESFLQRFAEALQQEHLVEGYVFFDEIQYLRDWEVQLKRLVDDFPGLRIVVSGSAAAALRLKSQESGAGRFTDFLLPPMTFHEYLEQVGQSALVGPAGPWPHYGSDNIGLLNQAFVQYLNYGGYPEVVASPAIQQDPTRFLKNDIVDKVLLRDLPSLYGIQDVQELNSLFTTLAYNTAQELSLDELSRNSGVAKNTIKRYIEYLEAAFLIRVVNRIDRSGKRFQRANFFKVYLTNPSIRSALFAPVMATDSVMGAVTETAIFAQWFHSSETPYYARWANGEVDIVRLDRLHRPCWVTEVKYTDRYFSAPGELKSLISFLKENVVPWALVTTETATGSQDVDGHSLGFLPASLYCYAIGKEAVQWPGGSLMTNGRVVR